MDTWKLLFLSGTAFVITACVIGSFGKKPKPNFERDYQEATTEEAVCGVLGVACLVGAVICFVVSRF